MRLRVWLPPLAELAPETPFEFETLDAQRVARSRGKAVVAALPKGMDCELVLHALDVVLMNVQLPRLSPARLARALPSIVEDRLAGEVERSHIVASPRDASGGAVAAIVDRALLRRALEIFQRAGIAVATATPQPLALPIEPGTWRVRLREAQGSVRTGPYTGAGFAADRGPPVELQLMLRQSTAPPTAIEVDGDCDLRAWAETLDVDVRPTAPAVEAPAVMLDLLQHEFSRGLVRWQPWRASAALGVMLVAAALTGLNLHAWMLRGQQRAIRASMVRIVQESFPQVPVVLDPLAQMKRLVSDLRTGAGADGGEVFALAIALARVAEPDSVESMDYRDAVFTVRFRRDFAGTQAQRAALAERAARAGIVLSFSGEAARVARAGGP
jgi:general secretion pathway protein L